MATEPAQVEGVPTINLGGKQWPVPVLALRQNKVLQPLFNKVAGKIMSGCSLGDLTEDDIQALVDIAYTALTRAHPTLTKAEFEDLSITMLELVGTLLTIMEQSGLYKPAAPGSGEAQGEASPPIGTA